jgi:hypothetical protein
VREGPEIEDCHQIVTEDGAKQAEINKPAKTEGVAI